MNKCPKHADFPLFTTPFLILGHEVWLRNRCHLQGLATHHLERKDEIKSFTFTLPETNIAHENRHFPDKYHQNGGFSMAMLVYRSV